MKLNSTYSLLFKFLGISIIIPLSIFLYLLISQSESYGKAEFVIATLAGCIVSIFVNQYINNKNEELCIYPSLIKQVVKGVISIYFLYTFTNILLMGILNKDDFLIKLVIVILPQVTLVTGAVCLLHSLFKNFELILVMIVGYVSTSYLGILELFGVYDMFFHIPTFDIEVEYFISKSITNLSYGVFLYIISIVILKQRHS